MDREQPQSQGNGMAVAGLVLGLCAILLCWVPFLNWLLALLGIIFGALGIGRGSKVGRGKGMAIAGLVCAIVGATGGVLFVVVAMRSFNQYMEKSKSTEASEYLVMMQKKIKIYVAEHGQLPIGSAGPSPAADCCSGPNHECDVQPGDFHAQVWRDLGFEPVESKMRYQYDYSSKDGKTFVAHAIGDADCDGEKAVWELHGSLDSDGFPMTQIDRPKPGVY